MLDVYHQLAAIVIAILAIIGGAAIGYAHITNHTHALALQHCPPFTIGQINAPAGASLGNVSVNFTPPMTCNQNTTLYKVTNSKAFIIYDPNGEFKG